MLMNHSIVADGHCRLEDSPEFRSRLIELRKSIQEKHASALAQAGWLRRLFIRYSMHVEYQRECGKLLPSKHALYGKSV